MFNFQSAILLDVGCDGLTCFGLSCQRESQRMEENRISIQTAGQSVCYPQTEAMRSFLLGTFKIASVTPEEGGHAKVSSVLWLIEE